MRSARSWGLALLLLAGLSSCTLGRTQTASAPAPPVAAGPTPRPSSPGAAPPSAPPTGPTASATTVPPVSARARTDGLIDVRSVVPDAIVDLRYATPDNFTGVRLYPIDARCLVHHSMAHGLRVAANRLRREGYLLVFWDCYRPHSVQLRMWQIVPNPEWVAQPGPYARSHESGRSVDVTLATERPGNRCPRSRHLQAHCLLDMGTGFDDFTARAHAYATGGISGAQQANRAVLRTAMATGGLTVYSGEWWHFDGPGADVRRPVLTAPLH